jgi:hypothetical protein
MREDGDPQRVGEGTFAGTRGKGQVAPKAVISVTSIESAVRDLTSVVMR